MGLSERDLERLLAPASGKSERERIKFASADRVEFRFWVGRDMLQRFERAKELLWHRFPKGRCEDIFDAALIALLDKRAPERRLARKQARVEKRRAKARDRSRRISQEVKDAVWLRDGGKCAFVGDGGVVCGSKAGVEYDHIRAFALGGRSDAANVRLLCRGHNQFAARRDFGEAADFRRA